MKNNFTPISVIKPRRPVWMTPDFNPNVNREFTPISVISVLDMLSKYKRK